MARLIGINHIALEVGDVDEALAWYGTLFEFELRGRSGSRMAFIDMGDQFIAPSGSLDFRDPWGNHIQVVDYHDIQFTKAPEILRGMKLDELSKSEQALAELRAKGLSMD